MTTHNIVDCRSAAALRESPSKAGLLQALLVALLLAPGTALADNECVPVGVDPSANLGVADSYDCDASSNSNDYPDGVTYTADGDLTVNFTGGGIAEVLDAGADLGGINLSATGTDSIIFDSLTVETEIESDSVTGALLDVTTVDGNIDIDTGAMDADGHTPEGVTHAIFAESTGAGGININTTGSVDAQGSNPADSIGIQAITGSGSLTITASGAVAGNGAAIDATTGTGLLTIDIADGSGTISVNDDGSAIRTDAGGDVVINIGAGRTVQAPRATVLDLTAAGETIVNNDGVINTFFTGNGTAIRAAGGTLVVNNVSNGVDNNGRITGAFDFSGLGDGGYVFNNGSGATWRAGDFFVSTLGAGVINNAGTIVVGNDGSVIQGEPFNPNRISAPGTAYTGTAGSVLELRVFFDGRGQAACDENIEVGACLDLSGGSTDGTTELLVSGNTTTALVTGPLTAKSSANAGIVLVDVSGGTGSTGDFVLHPDSCVFEAGTPGCQPAYATDPVYGAVMDLGGILDYTLLYNPGTQQHILASVPSPEAVQYTALIHEAASIWHTTSDAVAGRQADLREGTTGRFWARFSADRTERDSTPSATIQSNRFAYDQDYTLDTNTLIFGFDSSSGDNHVIGLHGGMVESRLEFDGSGSRDETKGVTGGVYAGWWQDNGLSLDGTLNANMLTVDHEVEGFEKSDVDILSLGLRVEAGWRIPLMEDALYIQPLATAAYMTADIDTVELQDNTIKVEDSTSLRGALGFRLGGEVVSGIDRLDSIGYWLAARAWDEQSDEGEVQFQYRDGGHLAIGDDRSGSFEEVVLGVDFTSQEGTLSGYLSGGAIFGDNEDGFNVSVGLRKNW